jgi:hypothetical protein
MVPGVTNPSDCGICDDCESRIHGTPFPVSKEMVRHVVVDAPFTKIQVCGLFQRSPARLPEGR